MQSDKQPSSETITKIKDTTSNPAPLGLLGFGMTTVLLNISNAGFYPLNTMILGMGLYLKLQNKAAYFTYERQYPATPMTNNR